MLARAARADEAMLGALVALDLGVLERRPIGNAIQKARDVALGDVGDQYVLEFGRARMPGDDAHGTPPSGLGGELRRLGRAGKPAVAQLGILAPSVFAPVKVAPPRLASVRSAPVDRRWSNRP